ncbi:DEAD/DEAH box helicase [Coraliomargarita sinensis]|uniref:DEAD/DEAH box helicase n=1 Tax=Coraliomargarita sinensis TaxID=2174842 RepID=A0A317ZF93_9BACT|nr:DEAD/DEAH box helicase [Coraliomargarita sinensis]PXA03027.1 DEAD/DEAH box helicase [Coraliomargarita sinensis]
MASLETQILVPDLWQQRAVNLLDAGHDVIVDAPTGSGKTYIFELLIEQHAFRRCIYTVPTRALANDKFREWEAKGWRVGIETGDLCLNPDAPVIVATLETQKRRLMLGKGPDLLVVDEYQMLGDPARGMNYELALALAPPETRLLLLSGSVANPADVQNWLSRSERSVQLVRHPERPVPLEEISLDGLPQLPARSSIQGRWPRYITRALQAGLGPILIFAPRRKAAETLALQLSRQLEEPDAIALTAEQKAVAGPQLTACLKQRIAFHHSGMSYSQRAALVEPLAKACQLKVIVATTGLAAGINFAMRSVLISDNEYRVAEAHRYLRPDELLQMFGRAGRRGLDKRGFALQTTGTPRLSEARPTPLRREDKVDWPSLLTVLQIASESKQSPLDATRDLTRRLFTKRPIVLGLENFLKRRTSLSPETKANKPADQVLSGGTVREFLNSEGIWERKRAASLAPLKDCLMRRGDDWVPALSGPKIPASLKLGTLWKQGRGKDKRYGLKVILARFPTKTDNDKLQLAKWLRRSLREEARAGGKRPNVAKFWTLETIEKKLVPRIGWHTNGGRLVKLEASGDDLTAYLDYSEAQMHAYKDLQGKALLNPKERDREIPGSRDAPGKQTDQPGSTNSVAEQWFQLGLIDRQARPNRRGILFSFFNHAEGLAISAGLEDEAYPIEELLYDLANIRAGHRFNALALGGRPLTHLCQKNYGAVNIPGYLRRGLPEDYGEGASEILYNIDTGSSHASAYLDDELSRGDIERAQLEWRSLRAHIAHAPDYDWDRWMALKEACLKSIHREQRALPFENLPPLTPQQRSTQAWQKLI